MLSTVRRLEFLAFGVCEKYSLMPPVWRLFLSIRELPRSLEVRDVGIKNLSLSSSQSGVYNNNNSNNNNPFNYSFCNLTVKLQEWSKY